VSVDEARTEHRPVDAVAGLLAACCCFFSLVGLAYRPARLIPVAILLGLIAAAMSKRYERLAGFALAVATVCFIVGMTIAVITKNPIF
jgi:hypothetical protein